MLIYRSVIAIAKYWTEAVLTIIFLLKTGRDLVSLAPSQVCLRSRQWNNRHQFGGPN